jgi:hypothetical protein
MTSYKKYFYKGIRDHYPEDAGDIICRVENHFSVIAVDTKFAASSGNPIDKRLDFCAYFLALIKTLDERSETYETIRAICLEIVINFVQPKNKLHLLLKKLPAKLSNTWLATFFLTMLSKKVSEGFVAKIITDKDETYGFGYGIDILECGICKLFKKHHYQKYASILCEVDKITSDMAGLQLVRNGTIALGAEKCDFRFKKIK